METRDTIHTPKEEVISRDYCIGGIKADIKYVDSSFKNIRMSESAAKKLRENMKYTENAKKLFLSKTQNMVPNKFVPHYQYSETSFNLIPEYKLSLSATVYFHAIDDELEEATATAKRNLKRFMYGDILRDLENLRSLLYSHDRAKAIDAILKIQDKILEDIPCIKY